MAPPPVYTPCPKYKVTFTPDSFETGDQVTSCQHSRYAWRLSTTPLTRPPSHLNGQVAFGIQDFPLGILEGLLQPLLHRLSKLAGLDVVGLAHELQH